MPLQFCVTTHPGPTAATEARSAHVKLPKLELQRFNENLMDCRLSWEQHENHEYKESPKAKQKNVQKAVRAKDFERALP